MSAISGQPVGNFKRGDKLVVKAEDTLAGRPLEDEVDLVILATGLEPRQDAREIIDILKLSQSADGFYLEAHPKLAPVDTATDGVYLAGCAQGPKDIPDTVAQAKGAASSALILLSSGKVKVQAQISNINEATCRGCGYCVEICPYGAIDLVEVNRMGNIVQVARVNEALCKQLLRAGCFSGFCPAEIIEDQQILPQIAVGAMKRVNNSNPTW